MVFSEKELRYLHDTDFLLTKATVGEKVTALLNQTHDQLKDYIVAHAIEFPAGVQAQAGKIARGENYRQLPYLVLDYPRKFARDDVFALRTMFWWGHFFSITFQLGGTSWHRYRPALARNIEGLHGGDIFLGVGDDPWQHHREPTNYRAIDTLSTAAQQEIFARQNFLKLAVFLSLDDWASVPNRAQAFFEKMIRLIEVRA